MLDDICDEIRKELWANITPHEGNAGLIGYPDYTGARRARAYFVRSGQQDEVDALDAVVARQVWYGARLSRPAEYGEERCSRCGHECETLYHRYWECSGNDYIVDEEGNLDKHIRLSNKYKNAPEATKTKPTFSKKWIGLDYPSACSSMRYFRPPW